jgi:PAS domain S-box-containing protein
VHFYQESQVAQKRYLGLFEHNVDPILLSDQLGKITNVNRRACSMIKASENQLINSHVADLFNMKQASDFHLSEISITKPGIFDAILRTHLGREIPVEVYLREIPDGSMQLQWTFRELSERKDLDQVKEDLIEMVYHDLRSPLSNVVSSLETLDAMMFADQTIDSLLKIALRSTEHVQRLTNSLLDINRLEAGQKIGFQSQVNPADLLEYGVGAIHLLTVGKQIQIHIKIRENLEYLWVDEDMIRRVIINLLENAVKFTSSKGKIWVGAKRMKDVILFWVKDFGPGISPSKHEQIFEKFVRLLPQEKSRGLGLGLAYCRLAVQAHGGEIWVESQPGEGACFKFTLPITSK